MALAHSTSVCGPLAHARNCRFPKEDCKRTPQLAAHDRVAHKQMYAVANVNMESGDVVTMGVLRNKTTTVRMTPLLWHAPILCLSKLSHVEIIIEILRHDDKFRVSSKVGCKMKDVEIGLHENFIETVLQNDHFARDIQDFGPKGQFSSLQGTIETSTPALREADREKQDGTNKHSPHEQVLPAHTSMARTSK